MKTVLLISIGLLLCGSLGAETKTIRDLVYAKVGDRELKLDLTRSSELTGPLPCIVTVHGGGWLGGSRKSWEPIATDLATAGFVVANIEYRLAGEAKFPGAVLDCKAAIRWLRANAGKYGINPEKISGVGGSAGGHLIAMTATTVGNPDFQSKGNHPEESDALSSIVIMGSGVDQVTRVLETKAKSIANCVIFFGAEYHENPEIYRQASPITHLSKETPPILMLDGEKDKPGERYVDFRKKLDELGVKNEFVMIPGAAHGEWANAKYRRAFVDAMVAFIRSSSSE